MPTLAWNKNYWDAGTDWADRGEGWSGPWGTPEMQWYGSVYPRIHRHLRAATILEIACGYGRWTNFLSEHCDRLIGVDLVAQCVEACRRRFASLNHLSFVQNDGRSLDFVEDGSVDFVFSFDSLVHVEPTVIRGYLSQFPRILRPGGDSVSASLEPRRLSVTGATAIHAESASRLQHCAPDRKAAPQP